jgi:hypothetical protein
VVPLKNAMKDEIFNALKPESPLTVLKKEKINRK